MRSALLAAAAATALASPAQAAPQTGVAHPDLWPRAHSVGLVDPKTEAFVTRLMAGMSLEEKVGQLIQADIGSITPKDLETYPLGSILAGGDSPPLGAPDRSGPAAWLATSRAFNAVALRPRAGHTPIPLMFGVDAVHGNNNVVGATLFPHNIGLGAAHDPALIRRIGEATAQETAAAGIDWAFGPTITVPQDDRWGRSFEGFSERPGIVAAYAGEAVTGLQGTPGSWPAIRQGHVAASAKHFLGDGGTAGGKDQGDALVSEADLIRVHAAGYAPAIEAGAMTIMASFSSWNGVKMHGNRSLLTDVLKGRMGFEGFVVGDWNAHGQVPGCTTTDCPKAFNAGLDMAMAADSWKGLYASTLAQARSGAIPMARIDDAVRRILRVKARLGLFDPARPYEGRFELLGSPEHRALAREAVRKSLVLLKDNGSVLPIRGGAHVLVAGDAADDVARQSGGWTLSWQGTGNTAKDFPGATSIYAGLREAVTAQGGTVEFSADGHATAKPDVAVVVFGEHPYAEFLGDVPTLEFEPGDKASLALLKRLKAQGVPVVSVFLSGRPMWTNPEINASDAFVAAWFPGSEGEGVADVLVGDRTGAPRHDFAGRLSFAWPKLASQTGPATRDADPLFAYGYGPTYASHDVLGPLSEVSGVSAGAANSGRYFVGGRAQAPWRLTLSHGGATVTDGPQGAVLPGGLTLRHVDAAGVQEAGRQIVWSGVSEAAFAVAGPAVDLDRQATGDLALALRYRVDAPPSATVRLSVGCGASCGGSVDLTSTLKAAPVGEWRTVKVKLACFRSAGADLGKVDRPVVISTSGKLTLSLAELQLATNEHDAVCPAG